MHFAAGQTDQIRHTRAKAGSREQIGIPTAAPHGKRTMFAARRAASTLARGPAGRMMGRQTVVRQGAQQQQRRNMGGGG